MNEQAKCRMRPPIVDERGIAPSPIDLQELFESKYRMPYGLGWRPQLRREFGYYQPDDYYEALVAKLVTDGCSWVDVGCGRDIFPSNKKLAAKLSKKAQYVLGIDPDDNLTENPFLTERFQGLVEECSTEKTFDVVTLRMVAEHIQDPQRVVQKLAVLTARNGLVVVYTPNRLAPMSVIAKVTPFSWHYPLKKLIWGSEEKDTFPVAYRLNSLRELKRYFQRHGFRLIFFSYLDDCTVSSRYRIVNRLELHVRNLFFRAGVPYLENCLLAVFGKN